MNYYSKILSSNKLTPQDLTYMKKLGFAKRWLEMASEYGNFKIGEVQIIWNVAWTSNRNFFFEIARDVLPIGTDDNGNFIYLTNIRSSKCKIAILSSNSDVLFIVSETLDEFLNLADGHDSASFLKLTKQRISLRSRSINMIKVDLSIANVGDVFDLFPFGNNTEGRITRKTGEYLAYYFDSTKNLTKAKKGGVVSWFILLIISTTYFVSLSLNQVKFSTQTSIYLCLLFSLPFIFNLKDQLSGNWRRL